tara:strand:+ start:1733 stop:1915 length:183 start_codon:yes stop_codon:yes gene_type:complete
MLRDSRPVLLAVGIICALRETPCALDHFAGLGAVGVGHAIDPFDPKPPFYVIDEFLISHD